MQTCNKRNLKRIWSFHAEVLTHYMNYEVVGTQLSWLNVHVRDDQGKGQP